MRLVIALVAAVFCFSVRADEPREKDLEDEYPFAKGVTAKQRQEAQALYREGTALLREALFVDAAQKFQEALQKCQCHHPAIHYNMAMALLNLDHPIEMHQHLDDAINNGLELLHKERFEAARNYRDLLEKQLVTLRVRCEVPGAQVLLDGGKLLEPPGVYEGLIRPGVHNISALKEGHRPNETRRMFKSGETASFNLELKTEDEMVTYQRRWSAWKPWLVVGAGLAVGLGGGYLEYRGIKRIKDSERNFEQQCSPPQGCSAAPSNRSRQRAQGATMQKAGVGLLVVGGVAVVTGAVLLRMNRAHVYRRSYQVEVDNSESALNLAPIMNDHAYGISTTIKF